MADPMDVQQRTSELLLDITHEMLERLDVELSEKDSLAVATAMTVAARGAFYLGLAYLADAAAEQAGINVVPEGPVWELVDLWDERYGNDNEQEND